MTIGGLVSLPMLHGLVNLRVVERQLADLLLVDATRKETVQQGVLESTSSTSNRFELLE